MTAPSVKGWVDTRCRHSASPVGAPRRRVTVENDDFAAFARRVVAAHGRRIGSGDIEGLVVLAELAHDVDQAVSAAVTGLRAAGFSWADIALRLGITRQAAQQRFESIRAASIASEERA